MSVSVSRAIYTYYSQKAEAGERHTMIKSYLICVLDTHRIDSHLDQLCRDTLTSMLRLDCQHGYIAPQWSATMNLELADNDPNELILFVDSLDSAQH